MARTAPASASRSANAFVRNHLQDCAADYRQLDRIYLLATGSAEGGDAMLAVPAAAPPLRGDRATVAACRGLMPDARALPCAEKPTPRHGMAVIVKTPTGCR